MNSLPMHFQDNGFASLGPLGPPSHTIDPNSPEMFKNNMHLAQNHILRIQQLAQSAIEAMYVTVIGRELQKSHCLSAKGLTIPAATQCRHPVRT